MAHSLLDKFEKKKKKNGQGVVREGRGFILFISKDDMDSSTISILCIISILF